MNPNGTVTKEQAEAAAAWWADQISDVSIAGLDNGDRSETGGFGMVLRSMLADRCRPTAEQVAKFKTRLVELLTEGGAYTYTTTNICLTESDRTSPRWAKATDWKQNPTGSWQCSETHTVRLYPAGGIRTDYGPDCLLLAAADFAGVKDGAFPIKTGMTFKDGGVQAALGYHGEWREVLAPASPRSPA